MTVSFFLFNDHDVCFDEVKEMLFNSEITDDDILFADRDINPRYVSAGNILAEHFIFYYNRCNIPFNTVFGIKCNLHKST